MKRAATTLVLLVALAATPSHALAAGTYRYALLIGNNDGGPSVEELRYAESDVRKISGVLKDLGGYKPEDQMIVLGGTASGVLASLAGLEAKVEKAKADPESHVTVFIYYSGHAKQGHLLLGQTQLAMSVLRDHLKSTRADVKIGVLDACESGSLTREKGGRRGPSFLFDLGDQEAAKGTILISSSSEDEASQESDELGGSFFTHYLTSGLRGDADESGDRRVTLGEVYAYTYHRTVNSTAGTRSGTQHPTYSYDLKGQGDVVMTDVTSGRSGVTFDVALGGDYLIFDMDHEQVAAEIQKHEGVERRVALPSGSYVLKKRLPEHLRMVRFTLGPTTDYRVDDAAMETVAFEDDYAKGYAVRTEIARGRPRPGIRVLAVGQSFFSGNARGELFPPALMTGIGGDIAPILGATLGLELMVGGRTDHELELDGLDIGYDFFEISVATKLLWGINFGPCRLELGPRLAGLYLSRKFPSDPTLSNVKQDFFGLSPAAEVDLAWFPGKDRDLSISLVTHLGLLSFGVDENRILGYGEAGLSLGYRL